VEPVTKALPVELWDFPVRLVHWAFVALLPGLWWTSRVGDMSTHKVLGYVLLALIIFRVIWGFVGSETARFWSFIRGPRAVAAYFTALLKGKPAPVVGHNPLGGWSVLALLGLLAADVAFGLFTQDVDGIESGPLARLVSYDTADWARGWHDALFKVLLAAVALHVAAIIFYLAVKRDNLIAPMISGKRTISAVHPSPRFVSAWRAIIVLMISALIAYWFSLGSPI
jgi:cytochrome b